MVESVLNFFRYKICYDGIVFYVVLFYVKRTRMLPEVFKYLGWIIKKKKTFFRNIVNLTWLLGEITRFFTKKKKTVAPFLLFSIVLVSVAECVLYAAGFPDNVVWKLSK